MDYKEPASMDDFWHFISEMQQSISTQFDSGIKTWHYKSTF